MSTAHGPLRVGIGGPVGSGKTALMEALCKSFRDRFDLCAITNDIYTKEDAEILMRAGALPDERIMGVETGGCPHTAIREDCSINLAAVGTMTKRFPGLDLILIESGGDNLAATFSPELADITIYVIDVAQGEKIPRKGGPGITRSDLLVINKIDLAPHVGASLEVMERDTRRMRGDKPYVFTNLRAGDGVETVARFVERAGRARQRVRLSPECAVRRRGRSAREKPACEVNRLATGTSRICGSCGGIEPARPRAGQQLVAVAAPEARPVPDADDDAARPEDLHPRLVVTDEPDLAPRDAARIEARNQQAGCGERDLWQRRHNGIRGGDQDRDAERRHARHDEDAEPQPPAFIGLPTF